MQGRLNDVNNLVKLKKPIPPAAAAVPVTDETSQASQAASTNLPNEGASRPGIGWESCNAIQRVRAEAMARLHTDLTQA